MLTQHHIQPVLEMINGTDMPRFLVQNIAQAQEMLEAVKHPALKMQYDCYHMAMMGEDVLKRIARKHSGYWSFQFADNPGRHEPDSGELDYTTIFKWLQHSAYSGYIAAEYRQVWRQINHLHGKTNTFPQIKVVKIKPI